MKMGHAVRRFAAALGIAITTSVMAQQFPAQPIRIIVPFPPGASTDVVTRLVAEELRQSLGQTVIVENRRGGTGTTGLAYLARLPADGYTIGLGNEATHVTVPLLTKQPPYDSLKDFTPLTLAIRTTMAIAVNQGGVKARTLPELVAASRATTQGLSFASPGVGSPQHLIGEMLSQRTGGNFVHVPYTGAAQAVSDVLAGHVPMVVATLQALLPYRDKLFIIAIGDAQRSSFIPDVPTLSETLGDFIVSGWSGYFAPANLPPQLATRLNTALVAALRKPAVVDAIKKQSMNSAGTSAEELQQVVSTGLKRWAGVIERAQIPKQD